MVQQLFEELLNGLGVGHDLDEMMVHMDGVYGHFAFVQGQFVVGDNEPVGFQQRTEPHNDALGPQFYVAGVEVVVQNEEIVDFYAGLGDKEFWGANTAHGEPFP